MGKSNSIEQQERLNKEFQDYIITRTAEMDSCLQSVTDQLNDMAKEHYAPFNDKAILMEGSYKHLTTVSEWSLSSVNMLIDACRNAIFGASVPDGTEKKEVTQDVSESVAAIKSRELFIANAAFALIQGVLSSFQNSTSTSIAAKIDSKPIAPGLTLFIAVLNNSYTHDTCFKSERIIQNMFVFKVYYSIKEGLTLSKLSDLEAFENQKIAYRTHLTSINKQVTELDIFDPSYFQKLHILTTIADATNEKLNGLSKEIAKLSGANAMLQGGAMHAVTDEYNAMTNAMKARLKAATQRRQIK